MTPRETSQLEPEPIESFDSGRHSIHEFRQQSVLLLILLTLVTLGIYYLIWLVRQSKVVNRLVPGMHISDGFLGATIILYFPNYVATILEIIGGYPPEVLQTLEALNLIGSILCLVLVFKIRNRMNVILRSRPGGPYWLSGAATFFLHALYLQYKINRFQDQIPHHGFCAHCGYDLRGLTQPRCPECGTLFDPQERGVRLATMGTGQPVEPA